MRANSKPIGIPNTAEMEKALITMPIARPRRSAGIQSIIIAKETEAAIPPKVPATARAINIVVKLKAKALAIVPSTKPVNATMTAERRSKRSKKNAPTIALNAAIAE